MAPVDDLMEHLSVEPHPLLDLRAFITDFPRTLAEMNSDTELIQLLSLGADAPMQSSDEFRLAVRDLLRHGGFKPTGRNKPASEYLIKAANGGLRSTINLAVDACNAVSLHSGLPISVVDAERARNPFASKSLHPRANTFLTTPARSSAWMVCYVCLMRTALVAMP